MVVRTLSLVQKGQTRGCSGCSTQWHSGIWWWRHCLWYKKVKPEDAVDAVCSGIVVYGGGDIVFGVKRSNQWIQWMQSQSGHSTLYDCIHWFDLFAPYTTIPLHTASTVSSGLTFLHQGQCPHHHIPLFYCVLHTVYCILHPLRSLV